MTLVVTVGETMGLFGAREHGSIATVDDFRLSIGGAESNVAIALARLGTPVIWFGRVGDDSIGRRIRRELLAEGVQIHAIVDPAAATGIMIKEQRTADATRVIYYRAGSAGSRLSGADAGLLPLDRASLLHVTGITPALSDTASEAISMALRIAVASGVPVSFDVNHRASLWAGRDAGAVYRGIAAQSTVVFAGEDEARILAPEASTVSELAAAIAALGPREVIIKLGADGCFALIDGVEYTRAAIPIRAVDTVGAGDAFVAGYLAELLEDLPVAERLTTAVTVGAFACLNPGDWEGYPRRDELGLLSASEPVTR